MAIRTIDRPMPRALAGARGQSLTEMIVMLPVLLMLFLGLFHYRGLVQMRFRAIEAARYVNWESVWHQRDNETWGGGIKSDEQLAKELGMLGLGQGLVSVRGTAGLRTLNDYVGAVDGEKMAIYPVIIDRLIPGIETDEGLLGDALSFVESFSQGIEPAFALLGRVGFIADHAMAESTAWGDEAENSVYTARVTYRRTPVGFFAPLGAATTTASSSLLSHAYNISLPYLPDVAAEGITSWPTDPGLEDMYADVFGGTGLGSCTVEEGKGRIFDLWLFPSGNLLAASGDSTASDIGAILGGVGRGIKCAVLAPFDFLKSIDSALGTSFGFNMPEGTLMVYPEKDWD